MQNSRKLEQHELKQNKEDESFFKNAWLFLGSARFAVFALIILAFFSAVGTLLPQDQEPVFYLKKYGAFWQNVILLLSLNKIYYAHWFVFLLILVAASLMVSNIKRFKSLINENKNFKISVNILFFTRSPKTIKLNVRADKDKTPSLLEKSLRSLGYKVSKEQKGEEIYYHAEKGKFRRWGSFITHTGILIVFLGVIYGHLPGIGFKDFAVMSMNSEHSFFDVKKAGFSLRLVDAGAKYDETGRPSDYYSKVEVVEQGNKVMEKTIRVNDPLEYKGIKFYQSSLGVSEFNINIEDNKGNKYELPVELSSEGTPVVDLPEQAGNTGLFIFPHNFYPDFRDENGQIINLSMNYNNPAALIYLYENFNPRGVNQWKAHGWVTREKPLKYKGYIIKMGNLVNYTGLQCRKDPGVPVVWLGFLLTTIGLFVSFYISDRFMRILLITGSQRKNLFIHTHSRLEENFDREISVIKNSIKEN